MFDGLNPAKRDVLFNLKHPKAVELVRRLVVEWADAVAENFAPRAMKGFGLDYDALVAHKPDLVMVSACLNGQTGPHKDYPGFGGQGSALAGYNFLTGWPDREPVGPHGTITDSLAPRFVATALAAGLLHRRRTGRGVYLDVSQVEAAIYSLTPWLLEYQATGVAPGRGRQRRGRARSSTACSRVPTWTTARAAWWVTAGSRSRRGPRTSEIDCSPSPVTRSRPGPRPAHRSPPRPSSRPPGSRPYRSRTSATCTRIPSSPTAATSSRSTHPVMGPGLYERNGLRLSDADAGYDRSGPTLGQDQDWVLGEVLGLDPDERAALAADGVFD